MLFTGLEISSFDLRVFLEVFLDLLDQSQSGHIFSDDNLFPFSTVVGGREVYSRAEGFKGL